MHMVGTHRKTLFCFLLDLCSSEILFMEIKLGGGLVREIMR